MADPELVELEEKLSESLGTRVSIERREQGGKLLIDFFSNDDLRTILDIFNAQKARGGATEMLEKHIATVGSTSINADAPAVAGATPGDESAIVSAPDPLVTSDLAYDRSKQEKLNKPKKKSGGLGWLLAGLGIVAAVVTLGATKDK